MPAPPKLRKSLVFLERPTSPLFALFLHSMASTLLARRNVPVAATFAEFDTKAVAMMLLGQFKLSLEFLDRSKSALFAVFRQAIESALARRYCPEAATLA